jgi:hypothetical protein
MKREKSGTSRAATHLEQSGEIFMAGPATITLQANLLSAVRAQYEPSELFDSWR